MENLIIYLTGCLIAFAMTRCMLSYFKNHYTAHVTEYDKCYLYLSVMLSWLAVLIWGVNYWNEIKIGFNEFDKK